MNPNPSLPLISKIHLNYGLKLDQTISPQCCQYFQIYKKSPKHRNFNIEKDTFDITDFCSGGVIFGIRPILHWAWKGKNKDKNKDKDSEAEAEIESCNQRGFRFRTVGCVDMEDCIDKFNFDLNSSSENFEEGISVEQTEKYLVGAQNQQKSDHFGFGNNDDQIFEKEFSNLPQNLVFRSISAWRGFRKSHSLSRQGARLRVLKMVRK